jgi:hypothetical protein
MRKGVYPNGPNGPSTDDLFKQIEAGVLNDVSMGLRGGDAVCDLCGTNVRSEECKHAPGTSQNVTKTQERTQKLRGVHKGYATYSLEDARSGEVSGVYAGAIPGAGFSKALEYAQSGQFSAQELLQFEQSYATLLTKGDIEMLERQFEEASESLVDKIVNRLKGNNFHREEPAQFSGVTFSEGEPASQPPVMTELVSTGPSKEELALKARNEELAARLERIEDTRLTEQATTLATEFVSDRRLLPAGLPAAQALSKFLAKAEGANLEYTDAFGKVVKAEPLMLFKQVMENAPQHDLLSDHEASQMPEGAIVLAASVEPVDTVELEALEDARSMLPKERKSKSASNGKH